MLLPGQETSPLTGTRTVGKTKQVAGAFHRYYFDRAAKSVAKDVAELTRFPA